MPLSVNPSGTSTWVPAKTAKVMVGGEWVPVKKMKVRVGSSWVLSWVHPVVNASLSLSKSAVNTSETYNVTLTAPGGFPEGAEVVFRFTGYSSSVFPAEGATTATLTGASHASAGSYAWYADVKTKGGDTTFGPVTQSVSIVSTTVTLTGPSWAISTASGAGGSSSAASKTFTIALSNSAVVNSLSFQLSYAGGAWTQYASWGANPGTPKTHTMQFSTAGSWRARAVATLADASVIYSGELSLTVYKKDLYCSASPSPATVGDTVTLTAWHGGDGLGAPFGQDGRWQYMYTSIGVWNDRWSASNPVGWLASGVTDIQWRWIESYSDGSWILSNTVRVIVNAAPVTEIRTDSGSYQGVAGGTGLVNAMRAARSANLPLWVYGTWNLELDNIWIPDGVSVYCQPGVKFNHTPMARFRNADKWPATSMADSTGGYNGGSFFWDGGEFDGGGDGIFTLSHSPGFTIQNTKMYNWSADGGDGHAIEINSSGGANANFGVFNVNILNNQFLGLGLGQRTNSNDEAVQWDWAWQGSGCAGAEDHTMCHNIRIAGNTSHRLTEAWGSISGLVNGGFAKCFTGGHRMSSASYGDMGNAGLANPSDGYPSERHNSVLIENNAIHAAVGSTETTPDKGAIALWMTRDVIVRNNNFYSCTDNRLVSAIDKTQNVNSAVVNITITGNTHNGVAKTITLPSATDTGG